MVPKILCGWFVLLLIGLGCGMAQVTVPDTPAGHTLQTWLDVFNSGDPAKIGSYVKTIDHSQPADAMISFHNQTGGFELLSMRAASLCIFVSG